MPIDLSAPLSLYVDAWNAAGMRWDCDGLAECFTEDALFFGGRPEHSVGREAIRAYFRSYIGIIETCRLHLREQQLVDLGPLGFAAQGYGDFSFRLAGGKNTHSTVRTTLILVPDGDRWRSRVHHFGPPPAIPPLGQDG